MAYLDSLPVESADSVRAIGERMLKMYNSVSCGNSDNVILAREVCFRFTEIINERSVASPMFAFWVAYLEMVGDLQSFLRGTREGSWNLHRASGRSMCNWFHAYDHTNYARYFATYLLEMDNLPPTHSDVHDKLAAGELVVQRLDAYGFAQIARDKTIEVTMNRDSKTNDEHFTEQTSCSAMDHVS